MSSGRTACTSGRSELQDLTECPICCLRFERPLQLNCGHSFCGNCVDRLVADARTADHRNDNFLEGIRRIAIPNLDRGLEPPHFMHRFEGDMWLQPPPRPPPPLPYPGLGGVPRHPVFRNYLYDEAQPFPNRAGGANAELTIKCPECRQPTRVPPEGLPVNYRLQELVARVVSETSGTNDSDSSENDGSRLPKCLVCDEVMAKGVYLSCRTCAAENETVRQLCSMCCLRNHNGHDIEEKRFLTMNDIVIGRDAVSEATGRGFQAVDQAVHELDACAASAKDFFQECTLEQLLWKVTAALYQCSIVQGFWRLWRPKCSSGHRLSFLAAFKRIETMMSAGHFRPTSPQTHLTSAHNVLRAFELIANDMQFEILSCHDELERKVTIAQEICAKLEQLPDIVKGVLDEYRNKLDAAMNHFVSSTLVYEGLHANALQLEKMPRNRDLEGESCGTSNQIGTSASTDSERRDGFNSNRCDDVRDVPRALSLLERRTRQLRMMQQQCSAMRRRRLQERMNRDAYGADSWSFDAERERHERLREELRNDLFDTDDRGSRERSSRRRQGAPCRPPPTSTRPQTGEERGRSNSVEIISSTPPTVADIEQRAGRLIITPERRIPKTEVGAEEDARDSGLGSSKMASKHRRGMDPVGAGTSSTANPNSIDCVETTVASESHSPHVRPTKRKIGVSGMAHSRRRLEKTSTQPLRVRFAPHTNNEPGPSFLADVHGDSMVAESGDSNHEDGDTTNDSNFEDLNFLE